MFEQAFRNIDDVLRKEAGCTTELDYTEQTSWLLFLKYLDGLEQDKATEAKLDLAGLSRPLRPPEIPNHPPVPSGRVRSTSVLTPAVAPLASRASRRRRKNAISLGGFRSARAHFTLG
jgi:hypothetical protein